MCGNRTLLHAGQEHQRGTRGPWHYAGSSFAHCPQSGRPAGFSPASSEAWRGTPASIGLRVSSFQPGRSRTPARAEDQLLKVFKYAPVLCCGGLFTPFSIRSSLKAQQARYAPTPVWWAMLLQAHASTRTGLISSINWQKPCTAFRCPARATPERYVI